MKKLSSSKPLLQSCFNFVVAWVLGYFLDVISSKFFNFDLNQFYSVEHFAIGIFIGTFFYLTGGRKLRGILTVIVAGTLFNLGWESFENGWVIYGKSEIAVDIFLDIIIVYIGSVVGIIIEKIKKNGRSKN